MGSALGQLPNPLARNGGCAYIGGEFSTSLKMLGLKPPGFGGKPHVYRTDVMANEADIAKLIEPDANALGFELVRVKLFGGDDQTLQVMAERPDTRQLNVDDCAALSRAISERFDAMEIEGNDPVEGAYRLEVSSPGIDRPLTRVQDFADWAGHEAKVTVSEPIEGRKTFTGVLESVGDGTIALTDRKSGRIETPFDNIASAKLVLTDRLIAQTAPLSQAGAEFIEEEGQD